MLNIVYIYHGISMLLILSMIVSIKRLLLPGNVYIKPSMVGAYAFRAAIFGATFFNNREASQRGRQKKCMNT